MATMWQREEFIISTDQDKIQLEEIYAYLSRSYWAAGRPKDTVKRSIQNSLCFGLFDAGRQIGFARVVTDYATFAYLCDVYVLEEYQGQGLGKWLMSVVMSHPELQGLRRWSLATRDAHGLYRQFGFSELKSPGNWMEIFNPSQQQ
jgi:GNAT superfamily N-acetyltransferase